MPISHRPTWTDTDREIRRLAVPALGALIAQPLYVLADTAVVGHIGTPELGGLALASSLLLVSFALFIFLAYGTTSSVARLLGAGEHSQAAHQAVQGVWLALFIGVLTAIVGLFTAEPLISLMGGEGEIATHALVYFRISLLGLPPMLVALAGVGYLRGLQDTKRPFYVAIGTAVFNLVLELILIVGFDYGIGASALSTVFAHWISAGLFTWWIAKAVASHGVKLTPDTRTITRLAGAGLELMMRTTALQGGLLVTLAVAARIGDDDLAAHEVAFQLWSVLALSLDAVAIAAQALIGQALGTGDADEARRIGKRIVQWGWWTGVGLAVVVLATSPIVPGIFSNDPAVTGLATFLLLHVAVWQPLNGIVFALDGILIGAGDFRYLAFAMVAASGVLVAGGFLVLRLDLGIGWLWGALGVWMVVRALALLHRFSGNAWQVTGAIR